MIVRAALIVTVNALVALTWLLSVTCMVKLEGPEVVGVPLICPAAEFNTRPAGKAPTLTVQVYCPLPPVTVKACK